ncbi:hypothetical protein NRK67_09435 [Fusobacteria bacterium ZRK30]|nr:hypothetical protein NRK67_09435 [Fusobacteria bacterium ZRK30]
MNNGKEFAGFKEIEKNLNVDIWIGGIEMKELKSEVFDIEELELFDVSGYWKDREDRRERDSGTGSGSTDIWSNISSSKVEIVSSRNTNYDISKGSSRWNSDILSHDRGRD